MKSGDNDHGNKKIIEMIRFISVILIALHCYYYLYGFFKHFNWTSKVSDGIIEKIEKTTLFSEFYKSKLIAVTFLLLSLIGVKGRKDHNARQTIGIVHLSLGLLLFFANYIILKILRDDILIASICYILSILAAIIFIINGGSVLARIIKDKINGEAFNKSNESFPQEERLLKDQYSLNLPAKYTYKGKTKNSWINFLNARRGILIMGSAGSGKSYFIVENLLKQILAKGHSVFVFDHKFPELTNLTYNHFLLNESKYPDNIKFYLINFSDPDHSHRCNPIHPKTLPNLTSAIESSKSLLLSLNRTWANKQGDFFVESPVNLLAAVIGFLRKYKNGLYCTLPHAIELLHIPYKELFKVLQTDSEIVTLINPFVQALSDGEMETLNSQMASVKVPLGRISSPEIYYVLSGDDFTLDINNPEYPKIFCLGNHPQQQEALAPIMSLFIDRLNKITNQPKRFPFAQVLDEFASARATSVMQTIFTGRSNNITTIIAVQDYSQLKLVYSKEEAETIFNITGNIISGQVSGETAKLLSERFAKTFQDRRSMSINSNDTSISLSRQLEQSVPPSTISSLSSGEFVGIVADNPEQQIILKAFHANICNNHKNIEKEKSAYISIPKIRTCSETQIMKVFSQIKSDISEMVENFISEPN